MVDDAHVEDSAEDLYEDAPCGYLATYPDGRIARVNRTFLAWTGFDREDLVGARRFADLLTAGGRIYHETHFGPLLQMQGKVQGIALEMRRADGSRMPVLVGAHLRTDAEGTTSSIRISIFDASDRRRYETELLAERRRAEQAAGWVTAVESVMAELAAASDVDDVCDAVARAGVTVFGAAASIVFVAHPTTQALTWRATAGEALPQDLSPPTLADDDPGLLTALLEAPGRTAGLLALRLREDSVPDKQVPRLLKTLGRQAGQALARALLFDEQRQVATTLQHSMLTTELPQDARLGLSACYRPSGALLQVGGDWYDAFSLDAHRVAVVVGDVVGRGLHAAAAMGQLRSAVRALAAIDAGPARLLCLLDRFVEGVPAAQTATLAYAELDLRTGRVRLACAGHPPPVLIDATGEATLLWDGRSSPLGAELRPDARTEMTTELAVGARLALYTDGLVERRGADLDACIEALAASLSIHHLIDAPDLADSVADAMTGTDPTDDDVCLLVVQRRA